MNNDELIASVQYKFALSLIENLSESERRQILADAVQRCLKDLKIGWEAEKILKEEALKFAREYARTPEVQEKLRSAARKAVDDIIDGIQKVIGRAIEEDLKSEYTQILSKRKYGDDH